MFIAHHGGRRACSTARRLPRHPAAPRTLILALALALIGCGAPDPAASASAGGDEVSLERALDATLRPSSAHAAEAFLASLPAPRDVRQRKVGNRQDPSRKDTLRTLQFQGIAITVYRVSASGKRFPVAVRVSAPRYRAPDGLRVGLASAEVRDILGTPSDRSAGTWRYQFLSPPGTAPYELLVHFAGGHVSELKWSAYVD